MKKLAAIMALCSCVAGAANAFEIDDTVFTCLYNRDGERAGTYTGCRARITETVGAQYRIQYDADCGGNAAGDEKILGDYSLLPGEAVEEQPNGGFECLRSWFG